MKLICFALGTIHKWSPNKNMASLFKFSKKLDIDGLELTFGRLHDVYDFKLSKSDLRYLKGLKYISIHAPFRLLTRTENEEEVKKILKKIESVYKKINAKGVIIHSYDIPEPSILNKYRFNVLTENNPRENDNIKIIKKIFRKYPDINLCLDVSHCYTNSKNETRKFIKNFKKKIKQIHLSGTYRRKCHLSLRITTKEFIKSIEPIKQLDVPLVIEEGFKKRDINEIRKEIKFIKQLLLQ